jgi:putative DNA primase/helicase
MQPTERPDFEMRPNRPESYCSKSTNVAPAKRGTASPLWDNFLAKVVPDEEVRAFLQRFFGYCLTGFTVEHAMLFLWGTGRNGKSVFLNIISWVMGDYAITSPSETFTAGRSDRHETELARLHGARLVIAQEVQSGRSWNETRIKAITGGDPITARFMRKDYFTFTPQFKLVMAGNHKPALGTVDIAIRRRMHLVPFTTTIPENEVDPQLFEKLKAEGPQILRWMLEGCIDWRIGGLNPPTAVRDATAQYLDDEDSTAAWLRDCCEIADPGDEHHSEKNADLFESWVKWCVANGERPGSQKAFSQTLKNRGYTAWKERAGRGFHGIRIRRVNYAGDAGDSRWGA